MSLVSRVIAIDPGRAKCGIAVVSRREGVIARTIIPVDGLRDSVRLFISRFQPEAVLIGGGTGGEATAESLASTALPIYIVDEYFTTQKARVRYFKENPPRSWRRLIPRGLLVPQEPYDDYAAVLIAEEFLRNQETSDPAANL